VGFSKAQCSFLDKVKDLPIKWKLRLTQHFRWWRWRFMLIAMRNKDNDDDVGAENDRCNDKFLEMTTVMLLFRTFNRWKRLSHDLGFFKSRQKWRDLGLK
jgi:hypothetical protein